MNKYFQNNRLTVLSAEKAFNILSSFEPSKQTWTNDIVSPVGGEIYIFFTENHDEYGNFLIYLLIKSEFLKQ
jgi:hypothetical protein